MTVFVFLSQNVFLKTEQIFIGNSFIRTQFNGHFYWLFNLTHSFPMHPFSTLSLPTFWNFQGLENGLRSFEGNKHLKYAGLKIKYSDIFISQKSLICWFLFSYWNQQLQLYLCTWSRKKYRYHSNEIKYRSCFKIKVCINLSKEFWFFQRQGF